MSKEHPIVFVDFHHQALANSLQMLFEKRMDGKVYFPYGMNWFEKNLWLIGNPYGDQAPTTASQYLASAIPADGTGAVVIPNAMTLDQFIHADIDIIIASYFDHIPVYRALRDTYHPKAKFITHYGNAWSDHPLNEKVLASVAPFRSNAPAVFYHQEFDTSIFFPSSPWERTNLIASFSNALPNNAHFKQDWADFQAFKALIEPTFAVKSFGGGCPDGALLYPHSVAQMMRQCTFAIHLKNGGDGYGHTVFSLAACGVPLVYRGSQYKGKLAEKLLKHLVTGIDVDIVGIQGAVDLLTHFTQEDCQQLSNGIYSIFKESADFDKEEHQIRELIYG